MTETPQTETLPVPLVHRVDRVCNEFETAWRAGLRPRLEDFHRDWQGPELLILQRELIRLEVYHRMASGEECRPEEYRARFPDLDVAWLTEALAARPDSSTDIPSATKIPSSSLPRSPSGLAAEAQAATIAMQPSQGMRYRILRPHAKGGLGEVFIAIDTELQREVALKEIQRQHSVNEHSRLRFVLEAEITGGLEHPGIVPVYGLGQYPDGRPYYAMRLIRGDNLKEAIEQFHGAHVDRSQADAMRVGRTDRRAVGLDYESVEFRQLLRRFLDVCNAVAYAHSRGVLHRDLKPGNIMLGKFGETLVVDWGLAKVTDRLTGSRERSKLSDDETLLRPTSGSGMEPTQTGTALGTPAYMSPEQAAGRLEDLGVATDIYSLGATLFSLLTNQPPVDGQDVGDVLRNVQRGEVVWPREHDKYVPSALDAICRKAMALKPADRYASALELAQDVEQWLADEPVSAYREPVLVRTRRWARKHRVLVTSAAAALVVLTASLVVTAVLLSLKNEELTVANESEQKAKRQSDANARTADANARTANETAVREREANDRTQDELYLGNVALADRAWLAGDAGRAEEMLNGCPRDRRGWEWHYLKRQGKASLQTLVDSHFGPIRGMAFSPDGQCLAAAGGNQVTLWDPFTGRVLRLLYIGPAADLLNDVNAVAFTPDGTQLVTGSADQRVRFFDAATWKPGRELSGHEGPVTSVAFGAQGKRLATADRQGVVNVWDAATGEKRLTLRGHRAAVTCVAFSPDGRTLASASAGPDGTVRIWDATTGKEVRALRGHRADVRCLAFRPDGQHLVSAGMEDAVFLWEVETGRLLGRLSGHGGAVTAVAFRPDGRRLASACEDCCVRVWDSGTASEAPLGPGGAVSAGSQADRIAPLYPTLFTLRGHAAAPQSLAFSPDGQRLASGDTSGVVKVWDAQRDTAAVTVFDEVGTYCSTLAFSPDGRRVATALSRDHTLRLQDLTTGQPGPVLRGHTGPVWAAAFRPDGKQLASAGADGTVKIWDAATGDHLDSLQGATGKVATYAEAATVQLVYSVDGSGLAWAGDDGTVRVWNLTTRREAQTFRATHVLQAHGFPGIEGVSGAAFSPDGKRFASAGQDGQVKVWDIVTGRLTSTFGSPHYQSLSGLTFSADGRFLAWARAPGLRNQVEVWDLARERQILAFAAGSGGECNITFTPDGKRLATAVDDRTVKVRDLRSGRELLALRYSGRDFGARISGLRFSPDGRYLAAAGNEGLRVWDANPGREVLTLSKGLAGAMGVAFSPDGDRLAAAVGEGGIPVCETASGRTALRLPWDEASDPAGGPAVFGPAVGVAYSPDGRRLAVGGQLGPGAVKVWDAATGQRLYAAAGHQEMVWSVAFSPDGERLASASLDGTVKVWDAATGKLLRTFTEHSGGVLGVAFSPVGRAIASAGQDKRVLIWDPDTGKVRKILTGQGHGMFGVAFSPDGGRIVSAGAGGGVKVWDAATGKEVLTFGGHTGKVLGVAYSPDGRTVASGGEDRMVKVWDAATGHELLVLGGHHHMITRVAFSRDGRTVASASADRTVRLWDVTPAGKTR